MKKFHWICLGLLPFFLCGCTATEVQERFYTQTVELSRAAEPTVQIYPFHAEEQPYQGTGATIAAALLEIEQASGRQAFLGHLELLSLRDAAFTAELSNFMQEYRLSSGCKVVYPASDMEFITKNTEPTLESIRQAEENGQLPETDLFTIIKELSNTSATALLPYCQQEKIGMALLDKNGCKGTLTTKAIQGLCWLRGKNSPNHKTIFTEKGAEDFEVHTAQVSMTAEMQQGIPIVTISLLIYGDGDAKAMKAAVLEECQAAERETVTIHRADVMGLEACFRQNCYETYAELGWNGLLPMMKFRHKIEIRTS